MFPTTTTEQTSEVEECVTKKPKIDNSASDMEISSDDEVQIIENTNENFVQQDPSNSHIPNIDQLELHSQEKIYNASNAECKIQESSLFQTTSAIKQPPKIVMSTSLFQNNQAHFDSSLESCKNMLAVESDSSATSNMPSHSIEQDPRNFYKPPNTTCTYNLTNVQNPENGLSRIVPKVNQSESSFKIKDCLEMVRDMIEGKSETGKTLGKSLINQQNKQSIHQKQKDLKRPSVEGKLNVQQNIEVSSSKNNMNILFGDDSDDDGKVPLVGLKKKSLGVRLGMSSNINSNKTQKKSLESTKTHKFKTEDSNTKQKKFELSNTVVKFLNPYYKNNLFKTKELFKFMAREIVHKLLESSSHPGNFFFLIFLKKLN